MMRKLGILVCVPLLLLFVAIPTAKADEVEPGTIFASVYGGLYINGGTDFGLGGSLEYALTDRYGFQGEFNVILGDVTSYGFVGSFVYNIPTDMDKIIPYATAGLSYWVDGEGLLKLNFGGGVKYQMSDSLGLKFDLTVFARKGNFVRLAGGAMWTF